MTLSVLVEGERRGLSSETRVTSSATTGASTPTPGGGGGGAGAQGSETGARSGAGSGLSGHGGPGPGDRLTAEISRQAHTGPAPPGHRQVPARDSANTDLQVNTPDL